MSEPISTADHTDVTNSDSTEFAAYCEAEFERRGNSDTAFDEPHYRTAMQLVVDKLAKLPAD